MSETPRRWLIFVLDCGLWLHNYDPFGDPSPGWPGAMPYRTGKATLTFNRKLAKAFASVAEADAYRTQVHPTTPLRSDGLPNRPLTAYSVEIVEDR